MLFENTEAVWKATDKWIKENKELYDYCREFEHKMIEDNRVKK